MSQMLYSVILPLYKQQRDIDDLVSQYTRGLDTITKDWELILVINGPSDGSLEVAQNRAIEDQRIRVLELREPGWGRAVRYGMTEAQGIYCCFTNSARTQVKDLLRILQYASVNQESVVKATRIVRESIIRKCGSVLYNFENRLLFKTAIMDVNGTPKVFPKNIWTKLEIQSNGDLIDAEAMAKCFRAEVPVIEVPVRITQRRSGTSTTRIKSAFAMYWGLVRMYLSL